MIIRKAAVNDISAVAEIYADVHTAEEAGLTTIGWVRDIYPTRATAEEALRRDDLFVMEEEGEIIGAAVINTQQVDEYKNGNWQYVVPEDKVMVLHTLVISPKASGKGYGKKFISYYEDYARLHGRPYLRMDTNERNAKARRMYNKLGYKEVGITPCSFNGIEGVNLVMLEKYCG